jgi:hypothetical protein
MVFYGFFVIPTQEGSSLFILDLSDDKVDPSFLGMTKTTKLNI